ncbi:heparinase II/III domain-containing protein [Halocatena halophila]|uniref:heparinase II/III domain-containing protein n=1 Tax=Halocatena halophila TaxID=2814576 RepID=UPI002ECFD6C2
MPTSDDECGDSSVDTTALLDVTRRGFLGVSGLAAVGMGAIGTTPAAGQLTGTKGGPSYYTQSNRKAARWNVSNYDWAQQESTTVRQRADQILDTFCLEELWQYVGSQDIPRAAWLAPPAQTLPPTSGEWTLTETVSETSFVATPETRWTVTNGEYTLPTNDFEAYRRSGLDERGTFDPERADESLLVNERHPEMGRSWGVDDGLGWIDTNGDLGPPDTKWVPVAYAHHWAIVYGCREMLEAFARAYLFTNDCQYARAATVLLDRLADVYPSFSLQDTRYFDDGYTEVNGFVNPSHGGTGRGKQLGSIWESFWIKAPLRAYDAVYPAQADDDRLVSFCSKQASSYPGLESKDSINAIRGNIETNLLQEVLPAIKAAQIRGNVGSHQATLALSAVVQDDSDGYSQEAIDFLLQEGGLEQLDEDGEWGTWEVSGGNLHDTILESFDRDGFPDEGSIHYNSLVKTAVSNVTEILSRTDVDQSFDWLLDRLFTNEPALAFNGRYVPSIGDTKAAGRPGIDELVEVEPMIGACVSSQSDELAKWLYHRNGDSTDGLREQVFEWEPTSVLHRVERVMAADGPLDLDSRQLAGFGFTGLRANTAAKNAVWTYYGRNAYEIDGTDGSMHCHRDTLNLGLFAHGLDCTPDLGYPERTGKWPKRMHWTKNTVSHNTVVVDDRPQNKAWVGMPRRFDHTDRVQLFSVAAPDHYDSTDEYRRTTAQITVDESDAYVVDFFCVDGGSEHLYSFHGAQTVDEHAPIDENRTVVIRDGDGAITTTATDDNIGINVTSPSPAAADWAGVVIHSGHLSSVSVTVRPVLAEDSLGVNQSIYLGQTEDGRHVCAGFGRFDGQRIRVGLFYPARNEWGSYRTVCVDPTIASTRTAETTRAGYANQTHGAAPTVELSVELAGGMITIRLEHDGNQIATHSASLSPFSPDSIGVFGAIGTKQVGRIRFDSLVIDGTAASMRPNNTPVGVSTTGLSLESQPSGTYAGTSVPKPEPGETTPYDSVVGNGYNYLDDVRRDSDPASPFSVEWRLSDYWGVHEEYDQPVRLRLTQLEPASEVALASGDPPQAWGNPETFTYLLARRSGTDLSSTFTGVIEPYTERFVESVHRIPIDGPDPTARAVAVELANGRTDYVASTNAPTERHVVGDQFSFTGAFAVLSKNAGDGMFAYLNEGTSIVDNDGTKLLSLSTGRIEGTVADFSRQPSERYFLELELDQSYETALERFDLCGRWCYADSVADRNGAYEIHGISGKDGTRLVLDLKNTPTIDKPADDGYDYILEPGGQAVIPLSAQRYV